METRRMTIDEDYTPERLHAEVLSLEDERDRREKAKVPPWRLLGSFVDDIEETKNDPWVTLKLVDEEIIRVRVGATVVLIGGPASGKTTLAANLMMQHAWNDGPVVAGSLELPGLEFTARCIGIKCDASWEDVLVGKVANSEMKRVTATERFGVLERDFATLDNIARCVDDLRAKCPGQTILVAVDYAQLLESTEREARMKVTDAFKRIDKLARDKKVVVLALSQMGRPGAKAARTGEAIGYDASELGAESSAIERYATATLTLGKKSDANEDGSQTVELSIGKMRMGIGDRVVPMRTWGRSGLWRVDGEAKTSSVVRAERDVEATLKLERQLQDQLVGAAARSNEPLSRDALVGLVSGNKKRKLTAINVLVQSKELVEVAKRASRSRNSWCLWTSDRAKAAGIKLKEELEGDAS